ncbi:MAG TPA: uroporphyrinogen-III synthase [Pseudolabrys sp.]|nr:uroporphyrinogen-III synthase [Pseudolabrys sp.]
MRVVVTRPKVDSERTAAALRSLGHDVLVTPLLSVQPIQAELSGEWGAVAITSPNALYALAGDLARSSLLKLPLFAVGTRSAEAARQAGFIDVLSADGNADDLVRLIASRYARSARPLLYLAGEDRSTDLVSQLAALGVRAEMRIVYRAVAVPFPPELVKAIGEGQIDAVLHFSRRSAENYVRGAKTAGILPAALAVRHFCLSRQVAEGLPGAERVLVAVRPSEAGLIELLA